MKYARGFVLGLLLSSGAMAVAAQQQNATTVLNIAPAPLGEALTAFAQQSGLQIILDAHLAEGVQSQGVSGTYDIQTAIEKLLAQTAFGALWLDNHTIAIRPLKDLQQTNSEHPAARSQAMAQVAGSLRVARGEGSQAGREGTDENSPSEQNSAAAADSRPLDRAGELITVTGSRIRGAQPSSPMITITQDDMRLAGHNDLGEVMRALPQNFSGGQNPGVVIGATIGGPGNQNISGGSGLNLRGLGADATVTLLNGTRLPYDGFAQATDVSVVPVAAIERLEVLLDGASAIYGSDAVGGVANIILKRDYQGAEFSARYGKATAGGYEQQQYTAVGGRNWGGGGFILTGDLTRNTNVQASQRDYTRYLSVPQTSLYPRNDQKGVLFSGHQDLGSVAEFTLDAFYTERSNEYQYLLSVIGTYLSDTKLWGAAPAVKFGLPGGWTTRVQGFIGRDESNSDQKQFNIATGALLGQSRSCSCNEAESANVEVEGPLFAMPGGTVRLSLGGGTRKNGFEQVNLATGIASPTGSDRSRYFYGESLLPLLGPDQAIPLVTRLSLNAALRYEDYDSFGEVTTPKVGLNWSLTHSVDLKASWGKSFKVPTLSQLFSNTNIQHATAASRGAVGAPANAMILFLNGGNPVLGPERAEILTAGLALHPQSLPGLTLELGWFDIDYTDRVVSPIASAVQTFSNPAYADFVVLSPTNAQQAAAFAMAGMPVGTFTFASAVPYNAANVFAVVDNRYTNSTNQKISGVDVSARYSYDALGGRATASGSASWLDSQRKLTRLSAEIPVAGTVFFPAKFRARGLLSWSRDGWSLSGAVNHIDGLDDTNVTPAAQRGSMTTLDLTVDRRVTTSVLGEMEFNLALSNVFDRRPPFMQPGQPYYVNYDSTNYSALGRVVGATITKRF